jgi:radical SAM family uncharacterized protein
MEDILLKVNKPARYIGREWNVSEKNFEQAKIKFALCFPDLYEVGMSNLGIRIIYGILNSIPDVTCERFFAVAADMEYELRNRQQEILSLESRRRLKDFDFIGFSLGYELSYTNILNILDLGGISLKSSERTQADPLVIGGGPCVLNPEPMADFFDLFVIGEAEEIIVEIISVYRSFKDSPTHSKKSREYLLYQLSRIEGVYVPSLYEVSYTPQGRIAQFQPKTVGVPARIKKRFIRDLNHAYFPVDWLLPYIEIIHDRLSLEIMRGCPNSCRFCQAKQQYSPFRQRQADNLLNLACQLQKNTGYEEISLAGLSVSDYKNIESLVKSLIDLFKAKAVNLSLPSIKPRAIVGELSSIIAKTKKTGLTFAPEAGTERLRGVLAKDFNLEIFFEALRQAYSCGYHHIKLYFMVGLPGEREEDLDSILELANRTSELSRQVNRRPAQVNISVNTLIPKPHTAFQWLGMQDLEGVRRKQDYLKNKLRQWPAARQGRLKISFHNRYMSYLEGVLSRGDRRLSQVILNAFLDGCRLDGWEDYFKFESWISAFEAAELDPNFYLRERSQDELLPWDFLDIGANRHSLEEQASKVGAENKLLP